MRHLTLICVLLFLFAGFFDYQTSHEVDQLDQKIAAVREQTTRLRSDSKLLQTEWDQLDSASHLRPLAEQFLKLQQATPDQFVALDQLSRRLPAAGAPPQTAVQLAMAQEKAAEAAVHRAQDIQLAAAKAAQTPAVASAPVQLAALVPAVAPAAAQDDGGADDADDHAGSADAAAKIAASLAPASVPAGAKTAGPAEVKPAVLAQAARPVAKPRPIRAPVAPEQLAQASRPVYAPRLEGRPVSLRTAPARPVLVAANLPMRPEPVRSVSALGMAQDSTPLPAPVAVSDAAWRGE